MKSDNYTTHFGRKELVKCLITLIVSVFIFRCVFVPVYIPTSSMEPTIKRNSLHFAYRLPFLFGNGKINRGDVVVFKESDGRLLCKRVIGIGGDEIYIHDGNVFLNCELLTEPYIADGISTDADMEEYTVPEGKVFLLGDNRGNSMDSRSWDEPYVDAAEIYAKVNCCPVCVIQTLIVHKRSY